MRITTQQSMTYTVWSHGELVGETTLSYVRVFPTIRTGDLEATETGRKLIERLTQVRRDIYDAGRRLRKKQKPIDETDLETLKADMMAQEDQIRALELELHAPDGSLIPTERIDLTDTEYLIAIGKEADEEDEFSNAALADAIDPVDLMTFEEDIPEFEEDSPPWLPAEPEKEFPRYQISVTLEDEWSVP